MRPFEAALRRETIGSTDVGSEAALVEAIREEIREKGPITFARFMERALYEPGLGYYRRPAEGPGRAGDFLTAPETHPAFGRIVARQLDEVWRVLGRPGSFTIREHGAGTGTLAAAILDGLAADRSPVLERIGYQAVDVDDERIARLRSRLVDGGHGDRIDRAARTPIIGCVLANEVLDALPVHRVRQRGTLLREVMVGLEGERFVDVELEPSTPALAERLAGEDVSLRDGQIAEVCLAVDSWVEKAASELERGVLLLIDYGYPAAELYGPKRLAGTLMAYVGHRAHDDPYVNVGRQDLTAHVDLTAVQEAALRAGLARVGTTTQAEFLVALGLGDLLIEAQADESTSLASYLELRSSVARLIDPAATGAFRVMAFGRGMPDDVRLSGFQLDLRRSRTQGASRNAS